MNIMTWRDFIRALRHGRYTFVGSYPNFFYTKDGSALCYTCARENALLIGRAMREGFDSQWVVVGTEVNWEDTDLICSHCGNACESAYGDDESSDNEGYERAKQCQHL